MIGSFGPSTIQPVVAASRLPSRLKDQIRDLLIELGDDPNSRPVLDHGFIQGFVPVDDAAYNDIRAMLATIEAADWTSLTQTTAETPSAQLRVNDLGGGLQLQEPRLRADHRTGADPTAMAIGTYSAG